MLEMVPDKLIASLTVTLNHVSCHRLLPRKLPYSGCIKKCNPSNVFPGEFLKYLPSIVNTAIAVAQGEEHIAMVGGS